MPHARDWTQPSDEKLVDYEVRGGVALLTLSDPPANTYSYGMMRQLDEAILRARFDPSAHLLVLAGAGSKFFCAGANIQMLQEVTPLFKYYFCLHANETLNRLEQTPKLVIAAINGHCVGGGLEIALAADLRVARKGDGKIGLPEVNLGVLPGTGGTQRLSRTLGRARALELMVEGKTLSVDEAKALGLVSRIFGAENFLQDVLAYAAEFVPPKRASMAVGHIKRAVLSGSEMGLAEGLALERELQQRLFLSNDAAEGIATYNLSQIQRLDAGYWFSPENGESFPFRGQGVRIPTLSEALSALPTLRFNIDLKTANADQVSAFSRLIREEGATNRICCGTESDDLAAILFEALPDACHFYPRQALTHFVLAVRAGEPPALDPRFAVLDMPFAYQEIPLIDAQLLEAAKRLGRWVNVWTVDEPARMRELIGLGVGGIMTDRPDLLRQALDERRGFSN